VADPFARTIAFLKRLGRAPIRGWKTGREPSDWSTPQILIGWMVLDTAGDEAGTKNGNDAECLHKLVYRNDRGWKHLTARKLQT
jgi:hypothetical protein